MVYLDSSAIVKLVVAEAESAALHRYLVTQREHVSSALARVEVCRAVRRTDVSEATSRRAEQVLAHVGLIALDEPLLRDAAALSPTGLRSLDAVHLATALSLEALDVIVTYDRRLHAAASQAGLAVESPA